MGHHVSEGAVRNQHIFDYLDYYIELAHPPHFAVMLTGPWGIGKSYTIKQYLEGLKERGKKSVYVSLYGMQSVDEIDVAILAGLNTLTDNKLVRYGGRIGRAALKKLTFGNDTELSRFLPNDWCDLIVFDDIERAGLTPIEVLGFVNTFVEHDGRRVVIIANEEEIDGKENYRRLREKVIGMTFELVDQSEEALSHFISKVEDEDARKFLKEEQETVHSIFEQSQTHNLRILEQSVRAWERVYKVIPSALRSKRKGVVALLRLFFALSLEVKAGRIGSEDLIDRVQRIVAGRMSKRDGKEDVGTPMSNAQERYPHIYLHDGVLSDEVLISILCEGRIDADAIEQALTASEHFSQPDEEPNWQKVWHGFLRDEKEFEAAWQGMEKEFEERKFEHPGEVLHVFGLRLWATEIGQLQKTPEVIIKECKDYVDALSAAGRLPQSKLERLRDTSHGLRYHKADAPEFRDLVAYYEARSAEAYRSTWPSLADGLLADMVGDPEKFHARICYSARLGHSDCADIPVLSVIDVAAFVEKLLSMPPTAQRTIFEGLKERYDHGKLGGPLVEERDWIVAVRGELTSRLGTLSPIRRHSISSDFQRLVAPLLSKGDTTESA
jgi:hypothetical protein